jgi:hypothetical protein
MAWKWRGAHEKRDVIQFEGNVDEFYPWDCLPVPQYSRNVIASVLKMSVTSISVSPYLSKWQKKERSDIFHDTITSCCLKHFRTIFSGTSVTSLGMVAVKVSQSEQMDSTWPLVISALLEISPRGIKYSCKYVLKFLSCPKSEVLLKKKIYVLLALSSFEYGNATWGSLQG